MAIESCSFINKPTKGNNVYRILTTWKARSLTDAWIDHVNTIYIKYICALLLFYFADANIEGGRGFLVL